ncbi:hypothetical protein F4810DRAFT_696323 [Camillea tinctor]|nr:hypothetical protein F4810DRAFT_696323 [Camillea tinctor]
MGTDSPIYEVGQTLKLALSDYGDLASAQLEIIVRETRKPYTQSCGLVVEVVNGGESNIDQGTIVFLKLYDRRHSKFLREDFHAPIWTNIVEKEFVEFVKNEGAAAWLKGIIDAGKGEPPWLKDVVEESESIGDGDSDTSSEESWSYAQTEAYLTHQSAIQHSTEVSVYKSLEEHQGEEIPKFLASVSLNSQDASGGFFKQDDTTPHEVMSYDMRTMFEIRGIIIEFIDGFNLSTLGEGKFAPESKWQQIVNDAADAVHILDGKNILNKDVRPDNFLVIPRQMGCNSYKPKMIDFGLCRYRQDSESDADWGYAKWIQDEEGAVWYNMRNRLRKSGFHLNIAHSKKYIDFAESEI